MRKVILKLKIEELASKSEEGLSRHCAHFLMRKMRSRETK